MAGERRTPTDALVEAARAYVDHLSHGLTRCDEVRLVLADGRKVVIPVFPLCSPPSPAEHQTSDDCKADVLAVLSDADARLTTTQILSEMGRRDMLWGDRTVKGALAEMVRAGQLDSDKNARPPGYQIPEDA